MKNNQGINEKYTLLIVIIQAQDLDNAQDALTTHELTITRLPSVGGFLGRRNSTLLIVLKENRIQDAMQAIKENCRQRVEYIAVPLESAPLPLPTPTPITIGGASIFTMEVEHFEVI
ncbi:MAG: cyclic-di-AMP receptor [Anaerolineaceae bacterium]|nr:cyclic-di-AMP receptor [Anaerolineaceae bacterium]